MIVKCANQQQYLTPQDVVGVSLVPGGPWLAVEGRLSGQTRGVEILLSALNCTCYVLVRLKVLEDVFRAKMLSSSFVLSIRIEELDNQDGFLDFI